MSREHVSLCEERTQETKKKKLKGDGPKKTTSKRREERESTCDRGNMVQDGSRGACFIRLG